MPTCLSQSRLVTLAGSLRFLPLCFRRTLRNSYLLLSPLRLRDKWCPYRSRPGATLRRFVHDFARHRLTFKYWTSSRIRMGLPRCPGRPHSSHLLSTVQDWESVSGDAACSCANSCTLRSHHWQTRARLQHAEDDIQQREWYLEQRHDLWDYGVFRFALIFHCMCVTCPLMPLSCKMYTFPIPATPHLCCRFYPISKVRIYAVHCVDIARTKVDSNTLFLGSDVSSPYLYCLTCFLSLLRGLYIFV